jgi:hypothetical protein
MEAPMNDTEKNMTTYTYTIFDGRGSNSAWPSHDDVECEAETPEEVLKEALSEAEIHGEACGGYDAGDILYVMVWDEVGSVVADGTYVIEGEADEVDDEDEGELERWSADGE